MVSDSKSSVHAIVEKRIFGITVWAATGKVSFCQENEIIIYYGLTSTEAGSNEANAISRMSISLD